MTTISIQPTFPNFAEEDGTPLETGYIYIGDANVNPETNEKTVYWDLALTITAPQPIRTTAGRPARDGSPARIYTDSDYSMTVYNKNNNLVYSALSHAGLFTLTTVTESVADLLLLTGTTDGESVDMLSYGAPNYSAAVPFDGAGGTFIWASTKPKSTADKIDVFDPSVSLANQGTGVGNGCWVRHNDTRMETVLTKAVGGAIDTTLTETEASSSIFKLTGILTGNINVIVPDYIRKFTVFNDTTGSFTLTVKTVAGTGIAVTQSESKELSCDGVNVEDPSSEKISSTLSNAINTAKATVASNATTSAIWVALGNLIDFTGAATVTDFPAAPQAGAQRRLVCAGAITFTDNANLDVQGGTITVAAGDIAVVDAITTTTFQISIVKADGTAVFGGSLTPISTADASASATIDFTGLDGTYDHYVVMIKDLQPATDGDSLYMRVGTGATPTWQTANYAYHTSNIASSAATYAAFASASAAIFLLANAVGGLATEAVSGELKISGLASTINHKKIRGLISSEGTTGVSKGGPVIGAWLAATAITGLRFYFSTGNIATGRIALYGVKNV